MESRDTQEDRQADKERPRKESQGKGKHPPSTTHTDSRTSTPKHKLPLSTLANLFQMAQVPLFQGRQKRGTSCGDYPSGKPDQQWSVCVHHRGKRNQGSVWKGRFISD